MLITEDRDDVAVLRIEHGRVGALDVELLNALTEAVTASDRALVITGSGSSFSAGVDLRRTLDGGRPYTAEPWRRCPACFASCSTIRDRRSRRSTGTPSPAAAC
jgi:enoyl-CoA hydratase/carnithine racemase